MPQNFQLRKRKQLKVLVQILEQKKNQNVNSANPNIHLSSVHLKLHTP